MLPTKLAPLSEPSCLCSQFLVDTVYRFKAVTLRADRACRRYGPRRRRLVPCRRVLITMSLARRYSPMVRHTHRLSIDGNTGLSLIRVIRPVTVTFNNSMPVSLSRLRRRRFSRTGRHLSQLVIGCPRLSGRCDRLACNRPHRRVRRLTGRRAYSLVIINDRKQRNLTLLLNSATGSILRNTPYSILTIHLIGD